MQIQLKQSEIIAAIKQYVTTQGINLGGKAVDITFSATRGAAGIIADVSIEEVSIPGFTGDEVDEALSTAAAPVPKLSVVPTTEVKAAVEEPQTSGDAPQAEAAPATESDAEATPAKTTSLFN